MTDQESVIKLSVEEWCRLAKEGVEIPITTRLRWISMEPTIRVNKDPVTFVPIVESARSQVLSSDEVQPEAGGFVHRELIPGDVVLFERADGAYVCHRVYKILDGGKTVITWGDNAEYPDAPVPRSSVMGLAISYERNGKRIVLDCDEQRRKGLEWLESRWSGKAFIKGRKVKLMLGNAARKVGIIK